MKKHLFTTLLCTFIGIITGLSQPNDSKLVKLDTLYANEAKNVALFFPETIQQGIVGASNFVFTYNRETGQHFGLLQAQPGKESNLLVIDSKGTVYAYILKYQKKLQRLHYFIPKTKAIGNVFPKRFKAKESHEPISALLKKEHAYRQFSAELLHQPSRINRLRRKHRGLLMAVENIVFHKEAFYVVIHIGNDSNLDYDIDFLSFSKDIRKRARKKSMQRIYQPALYTYQLPKKIKGGESSRLVYVLPKFSLSKDRILLLQLKELNGERNMDLKIPAQYINDPGRV